MKISNLKVALLANATLATLMSDFNAWTAGTGTGGTSGTLPTCKEQTFVEAFYHADGTKYQIMILYTE